MIKDPEVYRRIIKEAVAKGELDLLLFGFCNISYAFSQLPNEIKNSISKSFFYKILHNRRIEALKDKDTFIYIASKYYHDIEPLIDDPDNLQLNITKYCIMRFVENKINKHNKINKDIHDKPKYTRRANNTWMDT